ncbi:DUF3592 domain-containing protein [uncultured Gimesia sp.]|jgi:hypothetical protein|uniref:DUF3592 domain-containing protein n=1 Tax=uncultured Gimesia sp. TaxID=1678688 RepID=UPI0026393E6C|nr:DUF3592 domain-containing protein [uncultured Gimesia sp.]
MTRHYSAPKPVSLFTRIVITVILLGCLLFGAYLTQCGLHSLAAAIDSKSWPVTDGVVTRSSVKTFVTEVREKGRVVPNRQSRSYSPEVEYRYTVDGLELTGTRVSVEDASIGTKDSAQAIVDQYPVHKAVQVSYQPQQPANAVLEPGNWLGTYRWFLPGAAFLLIPLLILRAIWFYRPTPKLAEVQADENHPARPHLLNGMLMFEEILRWEPGDVVHIRRARVGFLKSIAGGLIAGLVVGLLLGLLPAIFFLSGRGVLFIARFYLAISALLALAFTIGLVLYGRRREYLLDWSLGTLLYEIGWSHHRTALENIERLTLKLPDPQSQRNPVVDSHTIVLQIEGKSFTLLETNGNEQSWHQTRNQLTKTITELAHALNLPWTESHAPNPSRSSS